MKINTIKIDIGVILSFFLKAMLYLPSSQFIRLHQLWLSQILNTATHVGGHKMVIFPQEALKLIKKYYPN